MLAAATDSVKDLADLADLVNPPRRLATHLWLFFGHALSQSPAGDRIGHATDVGAAAILAHRRHRVDLSEDVGIGEAPHLVEDLDPGHRPAAS
jgi:hypothetical protein